MGLDLLRVPYVRPVEAVLTLVGNIFLPGIATLILGLLIGDTQVAIIGLLQFATSFLFGLGWFWALVYSIFLVLQSLNVRRSPNRGRSASQRKAGGVKDKMAAAGDRAAAAVKRPPPVAMARGGGRKTRVHKVAHKSHKNGEHHSRHHNHHQSSHHHKSSHYHQHHHRR